MRVLFFIESLRPGGKERRLVELVKELRNTDIDSEIAITRNDVHYKAILATGVRVHLLERKFKRDPRPFLLFFNLCKSYKPDLIHAWGNLVAIYAIPSVLLLNIPLVNSQITDAPKKIRRGWSTRLLTFPFSNLIVANSEAGLRAYNAPRNKSIVIHNGFDFARIQHLEKEREMRQRFNIATKHIVGMVASFSPLKDYATYIKAAEIVLREHKDVTFLCVGSGEDRFYRDMVDVRFRDKIKFLGSQENIESIMNVCDVGVLSTITEGMPNSLMEFMSLGKPVIATDGGGTKEMVMDNENGFLIAPKSSEAMAEKISLLLADSALAQRMGSQGRSLIRSKFDIEVMVESYTSAYLRLANRNPSRKSVLGIDHRLGSA